MKIKQGVVPLSQGNKYDYLGNILGHSEAGKVKTTEVNVLKKTINPFPMEINANAATPAATNCSMLEMILLESSQMKNSPTLFIMM